MTKLTSQPLYQEILKTAIDTFAFFDSVAWDALIPAQLGAFAPEVKSAIRQDIRERWLPIMKPELEALLGLNLLGAGRPYFEDDPAIRDAALAQALAFGIESPDGRAAAARYLPIGHAKRTWGWVKANKANEVLIGRDMVHSADKAQGIRRVILAKANGAIAQGVLVPPTPAGLAGLPGTKTPPIP